MTRILSASMWATFAAALVVAGPPLLPRLGAQGIAGSRIGLLPLPPAPPGGAGLSEARLAEATDLLKRFVAEQKIAGAVAAVARRGTMAYLEAVGFQDLAARTPMTEARCSASTR